MKLNNEEETRKTLNWLDTLDINKQRVYKAAYLYAYDFIQEPTYFSKADFDTSYMEDKHIIRIKLFYLEFTSNDWIEVWLGDKLCKVSYHDRPRQFYQYYELDNLKIFFPIKDAVINMAASYLAGIAWKIENRQRDEFRHIHDEFLDTLLKTYGGNNETK